MIKLTPARSHWFQKGLSGPTLVFIHGVYHGSWAFEALCSALEPYGYNMACLDLRGHWGEKRLHFSDNVGYREFLSDVHNQLNAIEGQKIIVGHSLGGLLALSSSVRDDIDRLILLATPLPSALSTIRRKVLMRFPLKSLIMAITKNPSVLYHDEKIAKYFFFTGTALHKHHTVALAKIRQQHASYKLFQDLALENFSSTPKTLPSLAIFGANDPSIDFGAISELVKLTRAETHTIQHQGHDFFLEPSGALNTAKLINDWINA